MDCTSEDDKLNTIGALKAWESVLHLDPDNTHSRDRLARHRILYDVRSF